MPGFRSCLKLDAIGRAPLRPSHGPRDTMRIVLYSGLLGVAGAACLAAVHIVARTQGFSTTPGIYQFLTLGCSFSLAVGILGVIGGLFARSRSRSANRNATTLVISLCVGVALLAIWTRVTALPRHIRDEEPLRPNHAASHNRRPGSPFATLPGFVCSFCAPPMCSAAVGEPRRWAT